MPIDLRGRPIFVTGASSGIGEATARACAAAGMPVAIAARRSDRLADVAREITAQGGTAHTYALDVADAPACREAVADAAARFGGLYAVFANAGYGLEERIDQLTPLQVREMFEVNFFGSLNVIMPALELFERSPGTPRGHALFCSSCLAHFPVPYGGCYSATKAAQHHFARAMRIELEPRGIHVSSVHPIGTQTEFSRALLARSGRDERTRTTPGLLMQPASRVADAVVSCLRRPRAEVWPGLRAHALRAIMAAAAACPPLGDAVRRRLVRKKS